MERGDCRDCGDFGDSLQAARLHRAASVRLRKRKDQAKREFLNNRRSGEFGYRSENWRDSGAEWSYESFPPAPPVRVVESAGPTSLPAPALRPRPDGGRGRERRSGRERRARRSALLPGELAGPPTTVFTDFGFIDE